MKVSHAEPARLSCTHPSRSHNSAHGPAHPVPFSRGNAGLWPALRSLGTLALHWHSVDKGGPLRYNTAVESPALACVPDTQSSSGRRDDCWHGACHGGLCGATIPWAAARPPPVGWLGWQPVPLRPGVLFPQDCRSRRGPEAVAWSVARVVPAGPTPLCPAGLAIRLG